MQTDEINFLRIPSIRCPIKILPTLTFDWLKFAKLTLAHDVRVIYSDFAKTSVDLKIE